MTTTRPVADVELAPEPAPEATAEPARPEITFGYTPGFDGLRAIGLLVILAYHHGIDEARGAIFTLSMFFTLSGYLIATLTLVEWSKHGTVSLRRFWERRARRLLPAAIVTVAVVLVLQRQYALGAGPKFKGDLLAALGYLANWRFAFSGGDYAAIFAAERPVQHFWSLAVEEQFYLLFPLLFVGLMALTRGSWRVVGGVFGGLSALSFLVAWRTAAGAGNSELAYYGTHTRASEILVGVALAFVVVAEPVKRFLASPRGIRLVRWGAVAGLAGYAWLWHAIGLSSPFVFRGGTVLNAALTSLLILACTSAAPGRVARGLGVWPLRNLGKVSYAVYLFHWPLYLYFDEERTGFGEWPLFAFRVGAVITLAIVSYHVVESPFRFHLKLPRPQLAAVLAAPCVAVIGLIQVVDVHRTGVIDLTETAAADPLELGVVSRPAPAGAAPETRILLVGDSVSWTMWFGMGNWRLTHPDTPIHVDSVTAMGCPIGRPGTIRHMSEVMEPTIPCERFRVRTADALATYDYQVIVMTQGGADLSDRKLDGTWRHLGDEDFDTWLRGELGDVADLLASENVPVLWATMPHMRGKNANDLSVDWQDHADNDPARADRLNELVAEEVYTRPGFVKLDIAGWLASQPGGEFDPGIRGDGAHYTEDGSILLADWLVPQALAAATTRRAPLPGS